MGKDERYDVVIIGAGHNGTTTAAYLAKCGLSVCVLEERPECGGAQESTEPIAGVRINPHAVGNYGGAAPGWEQLELWKYGFRMDWDPKRPRAPLRRAAQQTGATTTEGVTLVTEKDIMGWAKLSGLLTQPPFTTELLRATFWCPPHPPEVELTAENIPYMQVYKQHQPDVWTPELLEMTLFDLMDEYCETESYKVNLAYGIWLSGALPHFEGVAIPSLCSVIAIGAYMGGRWSPRGNMHGYYHAIFRCAVAHGAVFRTCCPVDEIIISNGRAVGVRLRDDAALGVKTIWADKAVLSAVDIKQTFLKLVGPRHLDASFLQRIKDISLKGGSLYVSHFFTREPLRYRPEFREMGDVVVGGGGPYDSREIYYAQAADVDGYKTYPTVPPERQTWFCVPSADWYDPTDQPCIRTDGYMTGPFEMNVAVPEYLPEGSDAMDKEKMDAYMIQAFSWQIENLNSDNIIYHWSATPYEDEHRNTGMIAGTWCGTRHCQDQLWTQRPLPELARYRTPIEGLYHCHQTSGHPGGLCLMAIPYNLMHMLIEDGIAEPGDWWYPSPWYIAEQRKRSAMPR